MSSFPSNTRLNDRVQRTTIVEGNAYNLSVISNNDEITHFLGYLFQDSANEDVTVCSKQNPKFDTSMTPQALSKIEEPTSSDVLCGRGRRVNTHRGNINFREIVQKYKFEYLAGPSSLSTAKKARIAARVVMEVRSLNPPGRFLEIDKESGLWDDIGDVRAQRKAGQGLREDSHAFCKKWEPENVLKDIRNPKKRLFGNGMNSKEYPDITVQNKVGFSIVKADPEIQNEKMILPVQMVNCVLDGATRNQTEYLNSDTVNTPIHLKGATGIEARNIHLEHVKKLYSSFKPHVLQQDRTQLYGTMLGSYGPHLTYRTNDKSITSEKDKMALPVGISDIKSIFWSFKTSTPPEYSNPAA